MDQAGQGRVQEARWRGARAERVAFFLYHLPALGPQLGRRAPICRVRHAALIDAGTGPGLRQGARGAAERGGSAGGGHLRRRLQVGRSDRRPAPLRPQKCPGRRGLTRPVFSFGCSKVEPDRYREIRAVFWPWPP